MKIWNKNFFLLWQGQLVSMFGDAIYSIALGFWVLQETGSTAIMGTLMALVSIPRVILGPFAGVIVDRYDRKKLIVWGDLIRGVAILFVAFAALSGILQVWMVMFVGLILGACSAFFNPAINAVFPDIVPQEKLVKANSMFQMASSGANIIGTSIGGYLFAVIGAPIMFLINGLSYVFSALSELFIKVPKVERKNTEMTFIEDFKSGIAFIFNNKGMIRMMFMAVFLNFLFAMISVLLMPWFINSPHLGMTKYGLLGAAISTGMILGSIILSIVTIKPHQKYNFYVGCILMFVVLIGFAAFLNQFAFIIPLFIIAFSLNMMCNTVSLSSLMIMIPQDMRGKVMGTFITLVTCISPVGNIMGGLLGELTQPQTIIYINCFISIFIILFVLIHPTVKEFLNIAPPETEEETEEKIEQPKKIKPAQS